MQAASSMAPTCSAMTSAAIRLGPTLRTVARSSAIKKNAAFFGRGVTRRRKSRIDARVGSRHRIPADVRRTSTSRAPRTVRFASEGDGVGLCAGVLFDLQVYNGVNFLGGDLNDGMANQQRTAFDCQTSCDRNNFCNFWSWSATEAAAKFRLGCWLKGSASSPYMAAPNGKNYGACPVPACTPLPARLEQKSTGRRLVQSTSCRALALRLPRSRSAARRAPEARRAETHASPPTGRAT